MILNTLKRMTRELIIIHWTNYWRPFKFVCVEENPICGQSWCSVFFFLYHPMIISFCRWKKIYLKHYFVQTKSQLSWTLCSFKESNCQQPCGGGRDDDERGSITGILRTFVTLWKANSHIYINENLKIVVHFLFRCHTTSVKLFGHG